MTALAMTLTDGTPVQFASCHDCEHRHWMHDGHTLEFTDVIARATKTKV
jgi:hypothetical protein